MELEYSERKQLPGTQGLRLGGTRLFGRVQENRRGHFIATRFIHVLQLPIAPLESYLVLETRGRAYVGVEIPRHRLSLVVAYLRGAGFLLSISAIFYWAEYLSEVSFSSMSGLGQVLSVAWMVMGALGVVGLAYSYLSTRITQASPATEKWINQVLEEMNV